MIECRSPFYSGEVPDDSAVAVAIWNAGGNELNWSALPVLCEIYGVEDPENLIAQLLYIRDRKK